MAEPKPDLKGVIQVDDGDGWSSKPRNFKKIFEPFINAIKAIHAEYPDHYIGLTYGANAGQNSKFFTQYGFPSSAYLRVAKEIDPAITIDKVNILDMLNIMASGSGQAEVLSSVDVSNMFTTNGINKFIIIPFDTMNSNVDKAGNGNLDAYGHKTDCLAFAEKFLALPKSIIIGWRNGRSTLPKLTDNKPRQAPVPGMDKLYFALGGGVAATTDPNLNPTTKDYIDFLIKNWNSESQKFIDSKIAPGGKKLDDDDTGKKLDDDDAGKKLDGDADADTDADTKLDADKKKPAGVTAAQIEALNAKLSKYATLTDADGEKKTAYGIAQEIFKAFFGGGDDKSNQTKDFLTSQVTALKGLTIFGNESSNAELDEINRRIENPAIAKKKEDAAAAAAVSSPDTTEPNVNDAVYAGWYITKNNNTIGFMVYYRGPDRYEVSLDGRSGSLQEAVGFGGGYYFPISSTEFADFKENIINKDPAKWNVSINDTVKTIPGKWVDVTHLPSSGQQRVSLLKTRPTAYNKSFVSKITEQLNKLLETTESSTYGWIPYYVDKDDEKNIQTMATKEYDTFAEVSAINIKCHNAGIRVSDYGVTRETRDKPSNAQKFRVWVIPELVDVDKENARLAKEKQDLKAGADAEASIQYYREQLTNEKPPSSYYKGYRKYIEEHFPLYNDKDTIDLMTISLARRRAARFIDGLYDNPAYVAVLDKLDKMIKASLVKQNESIIEKLKSKFGEGTPKSGSDGAIIGYDLPARFNDKDAAELAKEQIISKLVLSNELSEKIRRRIYVGQTYISGSGYSNEWYITIIDPIGILAKIDSVAASTAPAVDLMTVDEFCGLAYKATADSDIIAELKKGTLESFKLPGNYVIQSLGKGNTPLYCACRSPKTTLKSIAQMVTTLGLKVDIQNEINKSTPLHGLVERLKTADQAQVDIIIAIMQFLISEKGASIGIKNNVRGLGDTMLNLTALNEFNSFKPTDRTKITSDQRARITELLTPNADATTSAAASSASTTSGASAAASTSAAAAVADYSKAANFNTRLVNFWKTNVVNGGARGTWLDKMTSMYDKDTGKTYQYFDYQTYPDLDKQLKLLYSNDEAFKKISDNSKLIYPSSKSSDEILHSLIWRVPGYAGGLANSWFDKSKFEDVYENANGDASAINMKAEVKKITDSSSEDPLVYAQQPSIDRTYSYGILSPAAYRRIKNNLASDDRWIHILHIWGVNFESTGTQDYNVMITSGGISSLGTFYRKRMIEMFAIIKQSITETVKYVKTNGKTKLACWIPGIGLNNFLNALSEGDKIICRAEFYKVLNMLFSQNDTQLGASDGISIHLIYHAFGGLIESITTNAPLIGQDTGPRRHTIVDGGVLNFDDNDPTVYNMIVNAWDPLTFIGNGGARDRSLDGWIGGGATNKSGINILKNFEHGFACSAWLSNLHMIPELADQSHMIGINTTSLS
jgi:hypothetical protein